jgi:hypothetical protein
VDSIFRGQGQAFGLHQHWAIHWMNTEATSMNSKSVIENSDFQKSLKKQATIEVFSITQN